MASPLLCRQRWLLLLLPLYLIALPLVPGQRLPAMCYNNCVGVATNGHCPYGSRLYRSCWTNSYYGTVYTGAALNGFCPRGSFLFQACYRNPTGYFHSAPANGICPLGTYCQFSVTNQRVECYYTPLG